MGGAGLAGLLPEVMLVAMLWEECKDLSPYGLELTQEHVCRHWAMWRHLQDTVAAVGTLYLGITFHRWVVAFPPLEIQSCLSVLKREASPRAYLSFLLIHQGPRSYWESAFTTSLPCLCLHVFFAFLWVPVSLGGGALVSYWYKGEGTPFS